MLEVGIVCRENAKSAKAVEFGEDGFGNCATHQRFSSRAKFIDENEGARVGIAHEILHGKEMRGVGTQVILNALVVANVDEKIIEYAHSRTLIDWNEETALEHKLEKPDRLKAN